MIEIMAMAIMEEDGMDYGMPYSSLAEAALKALCGALPDVPEVTFNVDGRVHTNIDVYELEDIYNQLKQYGENNEGDDK